MAVSVVPTMIVSSADSTLFEESSIERRANFSLETEENNPNIITNNTEALVSSDFTKNTSSVIVDHRFLKIENKYKNFYLVRQ